MRRLLGLVLISLILLPVYVSAKKSAIEVEVDTAYVNKLNRLSKSFRYTNIDSFDLYAVKAYKAAASIGFMSGKVEATRLKVSAKISSSKYKEAITLLFEQKLELNDSIYLKERSIMDSYLGIAYGIFGNYRAGLPYLIESAEGLRQLGEKSLLLQNLSNTGTCYIRLEMYEEALEIYKEIEQEYIPEKGLRTVLGINLGYSYYGLGQYAKAKKDSTRPFGLADRRC